ncbi:MAG: hypothetical protein ACI97K_002908, partial [Glaciecola sp.]
MLLKRGEGDTNYNSTALYKNATIPASLEGHSSSGMETTE